MSSMEELSEINAAAGACALPIPQPPRPVNPVIFFSMTGDNCPLPKDSDIFTLGEQIGSGSFSHVYKAIDKETGNPIAIKSYRMKKKELGHFSRAAAEMAFIKFLDHPNIIGYILANIENEYMYLGIEYSAYGPLANFMQKYVGFSELTVQNVMKQLASALCYLHSMYIFHGDVKPENIIVTSIVDNSLVIKLSDFGLADVILETEIQHKKSGSFYYMAPEIHLGFPCDYKSDIFSAGVVMYEMLFGKKPFNTKIPRHQHVTNFKRRVGIITSSPQFEADYLSNNCVNLLKNLLSYDKQERLFGEKLADHPFLHIEPVGEEEQSHYMKACECIVRGVKLVKTQKYGSGFLEVTEAILHLKIHMNRIQDNNTLYNYTMSRYRDYMVYCEKIEEKLICEKNTSPITMATQAEKLRCLLKSTPALLTGYDLCTVGEMYYIQSDKYRGGRLIRDGMEILFPLFIQEPLGLRKFVLANKINQWINMLEILIKESVNRN